MNQEEMEEANRGIINDIVSDCKQNLENHIVPWSIRWQGIGSPFGKEAFQVGQLLRYLFSF
jgi:hypothetical protein